MKSWCTDQQSCKNGPELLQVASMYMEEEEVEQQGTPMHHLPPHHSAIAELQIPDPADISAMRVIRSNLQTKFDEQHKVRKDLP